MFDPSWGHGLRGRAKPKTGTQLVAAQLYVNRKAGYWTDEKKQELFDLMQFHVDKYGVRRRKMPIMKIAKKFDKTRHIILVVYDSIVRERKHKQDFYIDEETGQKVTVYSKGYANGVSSQYSAFSNSRD